MPAYLSELDRLLDRARELLGAGDDATLPEANVAVNQVLQLHPDSVEGWLLKCQVASATGDDLAALAAVEMALARAPMRGEGLYWRGAVLGDLGRHREALRSIEDALASLGDADQWLMEDLWYEKVTILEALGLHDAAVAACATGLEHCPGSALLRAALAPGSRAKPGTPDIDTELAERAQLRSSLKILRGGK
jgi:tetratricopeptide (TPR) repeat protein